uniref:Uncharacterized protein n=1 Tax=Plectus sambesii TaxID=2011161 RepID=A0A914XRY2_9BILA
MPPKITGVTLDEDQNLITVNWMLTDKDCPGYIRRYELTISCNSDQAVSPGNLLFDCRNGLQGPKLNGTVPGKCKSEDIYIKLRVGTANSTSNESEQYLLKNKAFSTWLIIAYVLGALLIAVAIASLIFFYYYKRHVKTYQNVYDTVRKLLRSQRKSEIGQSFRARIAPKSTIPDVPASESCNSPGETVYQTIAATPEVGTPHPLHATKIQSGTTSSTPRYSLGYTCAETQNEKSSSARDSLDYKLFEM